jgi:hypothetical protein
MVQAPWELLTRRLFDVILGTTMQVANESEQNNKEAHHA